MPSKCEPRGFRLHEHARQVGPGPWTQLSQLVDQKNLMFCRKRSKAVENLKTQMGAVISPSHPGTITSMSRCTFNCAACVGGMAFTCNERAKKMCGDTVHLKLAPHRNFSQATVRYGSELRGVAQCVIECCTHARSLRQCITSNCAACVVSSPR